MTGTDGMYDDQFSGVQRADVGDTSIGGLISDTWALMKEHLVETVGGLVAVMGIMYGIQMVTTLAIYVVLLGGMLAFAAVGEIVGQDIAGVLAVISGVFAYMIVFAVILVIQTLAIAVYNMMWLKLIRGQDQPIRYVQVIKYSAAPLSLAAVLHAVAGMVGMLAFIIPGYILMLGLMFAPMLVWDHKLGAVDALKRSWELTNGYKVQIFLLAFVLGLLNVGGMLACGVGMLVTLPLTFGALMMFYDRIATPGNAYLRV